MSGLANRLAAVVFALAFHFAANVFLVLAITQVFSSQNVIDRIWRQRFLIDSLFTCPLILQVLVF